MYEYIDRLWTRVFCFEIVVLTFAQFTLIVLLKFLWVRFALYLWILSFLSSAL